MDSVFQFQKSVENKIVELEVVAEANSAAQQNSLAAALDRFEGIDSIQKQRAENSKLRYQIDFLQANIERASQKAKEEGITVSDEMTKVDSKLMRSIFSELSLLFKNAIESAFPTLADAPVILQKSNVADFQCNSALKLTKMIPEKKSPVEVANLILAKIAPSEIIESLVVSGPGFINITINQDFVAEQLLNIVTVGVHVHLANEDDRIVIDYSSPNIAKEMHVGHLRSTIIGDSVSRLLEFVGFKLLRLNHVGDWGTQFGMLLAHLMDKYPDYQNTPPPISNLQIFYKESKKRFDEEPEFKKKAYEITVRLQSKEAEMIQAWQLICDISRKEFSEVYEILNISKELTERGESFYHDRMQGVVADLIERKLLIEEDGRKILYTNNKALPPMTIVKSDGGFTYDTSDMAAIKQRVDEERATRIIYTVDCGQGLHFQQLFECARIAGYYDPARTRVDHLSFGVVLGEDKKKFKTRSGDTVKLKDLITEGLERALQKLLEKERDKVLSETELKTAQEAVAIGCIKYADLSHDRNHDYVFSFDRMLDDRGNTAVYLLYALTRIRSIIRNANLEKSASEIGEELRQSNGLKLDHPREIKLAKTILNFTDVIVEIVDNLLLHSLCQYLYNLSCIFSEFYDQCYVIEKIGDETKVNTSRVVLCEATARIMETCLHILGIKTVEKM